MAEELGVWAYAITTFRSEPKDVAGVTGVDHEPVRTVEMAGLVAVVGTVHLDEFGEEPLRRKLDDLDSLEAIARAHHEVVAFAARRAPAVPMRLATVYRDDARVAAVLAERHDDLLLALKQIAGRTEWGVKAYAANAANATAAAGQAEADASSTRPGTAYLLRRRTQLSAGENARHEAAESARDVHETLSGLAVAARLHAPQDPQLTGEAGWMVLNGAYLVEDAAAERFAAKVRALRDRHTALRLELTGPWPAYSFSAIFSAIEDKEPSA
ncbi:MAG TPA: GvpL/GvpF family gas vesicle protein [Candidatus Limnocylindrales bacterium]|nr:GvpL/GvpF family gas vesicle protein [Candidatus Limnocylindrales bacterium]